ncbi:uncharacterized protein LTR77_009058 [Saxophila tyrrhenica]|uniref:Transcription initiation factor TFIID subunit 10 n=1 Tax=Saxophila tyrrhenica TaxID=1690608 RepID=A0AAV9P2B8_9PEZI|nr:hypothetical protein LTR77_009058 [Saxophila tyrrhenica]
MSTDPAEPSSEGALQSQQGSNTQPHTSTTTQQEPPTDAEMSLPNEADLDAEFQPTQPSDPTTVNNSSDPLPAPSASADPTAPAIHPAHPAIIEPRIPQKKDASLREFLNKMDDYTPLIPDAVTDYYLTVAGLAPPPETDRRLARLLALATQKFIADVAADAYQYSRIRSTNTTSNNPLTGLGGAAGFGMNMPAGGEGGEGAAGKGKKDAGKAAPLGGPRAGYGGGGAGGGGQGRTVLTMEDLGMAVGEYGVNVKRGEFYR